MDEQNRGESEPFPVIQYRPAEADRAEAREHGPVAIVKGVLAFLGFMFLWVVLPSVLFVAIMLMGVSC